MLNSGWKKLFLISLVFASALLLLNKNAISATSTKVASTFLAILDEADVRAPIDYGAGPSMGKPGAAPAAAAAVGAIPVGSTTANTKGFFGPSFTWPIIPIHVALLPDGRVMDYGTDQSGVQGAQLYYDVWDPKLGTDTTSHLVLANSTSTDLFCSSQSLMLDGNLLTTGGDKTISGQRNYSINKTTIFTPTKNSVAANTSMKYPRWYGSLVSLSNGNLVVFGGRANGAAPLTPSLSASTPERYDPATKLWTSLTGAASDPAFFNNNNWYYPRAYVAPGGNIFVLGHDGTMYSVSTAATGTTKKYTVMAGPSTVSLPSIPFAPGWLLALRDNKEVDVIDYNGATPVVMKTHDMDQVRYWANGTVLANGKVLVTGGSEVENELTGVDYTAQIWDPATGLWTAGAKAAKARLYHSNSLLMPDATVLTGGGGAPGPVNNLNAEIYYPPYLYTTAGQPAVRPVIASITTAKTITAGATIKFTVGATDVISKLTFIRFGSSTHSYNSDQRFINLPYSQTGANVATILPSDGTVLLPGYYMLFAFNKAGVPSIASIFLVRTAG